MAMMTIRKTEDEPAAPAPKSAADCVRCARLPCPKVKASTTMAPMMATLSVEKMTTRALPSLTPR